MSSLARRVSEERTSLARRANRVYLEEVHGKKAITAAPTSVTAERSKRLCQLLKLLSGGPQARTTLVRKLRLGVRGFYRDLVALRDVGIAVRLTKGKYELEEDAAAAIERVPFPDPNLTLGEARQLAKGRSVAHRKLRELLEQIDK